MLMDELTKRGLRPDVARTRQAGERLSVARRAWRPNSFGGCDCGDCLLIGRHIDEWMGPEIPRALKSLGLDFHHPVEAVTYGSFGEDDLLIEVQYVGVGTLDGRAIELECPAVRVDAGNHAPCVFDALHMPEDVDESDVYTITVLIRLDSELRLVDE